MGLINKKLIGGKSVVPIFNHEVPIIADESAEPEKGTGVWQKPPTTTKTTTRTSRTSRTSPRYSDPRNFRIESPSTKATTTTKGTKGKASVQSKKYIRPKSAIRPFRTWMNWDAQGQRQELRLVHGNWDDSFVIVDKPVGM